MAADREQQAPASGQEEEVLRSGSSLRFKQCAKSFNVLLRRCKSLFESRVDFAPELHFFAGRLRSDALAYS